MFYHEHLFQEGTILSNDVVDVGGLVVVDDDDNDDDDDDDDDGVVVVAVAVVFVVALGLNPASNNIFCQNSIICLFTSAAYI